MTHDIVTREWYHYCRNWVHKSTKMRAGKLELGAGFLHLTWSAGSGEEGLWRRGYFRFSGQKHQSEMRQQATEGQVQCSEEGTSQETNELPREDGEGILERGTAEEKGAAVQGGKSQGQEPPGSRRLRIGQTGDCEGHSPACRQGPSFNPEIPPPGLVSEMHTRDLYMRLSHSYL